MSKLAENVEKWKAERASGRTVRARLRALEDEVQELRQFNRRIAELTDVVAELLIPIQDRDEAKVQEVLARYRSQI
ncbi:DUF6752 domain-containing protein [Nocardioides nematodiphilus]|uniref:DUF6752 domain-containing protein n=1 Tax=Nocardioides nematodiphilus TaxID=2849669 RepID=UPI001CD9FE21|nr:DUF6752 domain-containing protein [Nocardioides nematodiphilus]MCA1983097.1 hypothetical protein [Nocardioides nematodiphilus]